MTTPSPYSATPKGRGIVRVYHKIWTYWVEVSKLDPHSPNQPNRPIPTWFQPESMLLSVGEGFCAQDPMLTSQVEGFLLQNPSHLTWSKLYTTSANSGKIKLIFKEIRRYLDHIWWDLARFGQIPTDFGNFGLDFYNFQCKCSEFLQILTIFLQIPATFASSDNFLHRPN